MARRIKGTEAVVDIVPDDQGLLALAKEWTDKIKDAAGFTEDVAKGWKLTTIALDSATSLAGEVLGAIEKTKEIVDEAAARRSVEAAFTRQFENANEAMETLRESIRGAISDADIQRVATTFERAGLSLEQIAGVFDVSARISATTGQAITEVVEELQDAIIGASDSGLEKFGIIADLPEIAKEYAKAQGIATDKIDKSVESAAMLELVLGKVSDKFSDAPGGMQTRVDQLTAKFENMKAAAADAFAFAVLETIDRVDRLTDSTVRLGEVLGVEGQAGLIAAIESSGHSFAEVAARADVLDKSTQKYIDSVRQGKGELNALAAKLIDVQRSMGGVRVSQEESARAFQILADEVEESARKTLQYEAALSGTEVSARALIDAQYDMHAALGTTERFITRINNKLREQRDAQYRAAIAAADAAYEREKADAIRRQQAEAELAYQTALQKSLDEEEKATRRPSRRGAKREDPADALKVLKEFEGSRIFQAIASGEPAGFETLNEELLTANERIALKIELQRQEEQQQQRVADATERAAMAYASMSSQIFATAENFEGNINDFAKLVDIGYQMSEAFNQAEKAGKGTAEVAGMMAGAALQAGAGMAKSWGASLAFTETLFGMADAAMMATKIAEAVAGNPVAAVQAAMYGISSAQHFAAAAMAGSKGGGGGRAAAGGVPPRAPAAIFAGQEVAPDRATRSDTIVFSGATIVGPGGVAEAERAIGSMMDRRNETGEGRNFTPAG